GSIGVTNMEQPVASLRLAEPPETTMAGGTKPIVCLNRISKFYGDVAAVGEISIALTRGELVCLLGPSGCGKTTTLRMVAGFIEPSGGSIMIGDQDVTALPSYRRDTGMVFQ